HFLPAALAQLAIAFGALSLAGIGANFPDEIRTAALFLFAVVLPVGSLIVADRTLRLLFGGRGQRVPPSTDTPPSHTPDPEPDRAPHANANDANDPDDTAPHAAEPVEPKLPQARL